MELPLFRFLTFSTCLFPLLQNDFLRQEKINISTSSVSEPHHESLRLSAVICDKVISVRININIGGVVTACTRVRVMARPAVRRTYAHARSRVLAVSIPRRKRQPTLPARSDMTSIAFLWCRSIYQVLRDNYTGYNWVVSLPSQPNTTVTQFRGRGFNVSTLVPELISYTERSTYI